MTKLFFAVATLMLSTSSFAASHVAGCEFKFNANISSFAVFSEGSGKGTVTCSDITGKVVSKKKVKITIDGLGLGLGEFSMAGLSFNLGILDPEDMNGTYLVADLDVGVDGAVGASLGFEGQENGLSFAAGLRLGRGWGARVNGSTWTIEVQ